MVLGLCGKQGSGKDTIADFLCRKYGYQRLAFADALRSMALAINPYVKLSGGGFMLLSDVFDAEGWECRRNHPDIRRFLQRLGTEGVREHIRHTAWIDLLRKKLSRGVHYVITDVRFGNEAEVCDEVWLVTGREATSTSVTAAHISEQMQFEVQGVLDNSGPLERTLCQVETLMTDWSFSTC